MNDWFHKEKITEHIYWIWEYNHDEKVQSYFLKWKKKSILFDTGMWIANILNLVESLWWWKETVVINSHHHCDHVGGNHLFNKVYWPSHMLFEKAAKNWISRSDIIDYIWNDIPEKRWDNEDYYIRKFWFDKLLTQESILKWFEPFKFKIITTPWHSADHISLFEEKTRTLFAWDLLYNWPIYLHLEWSSVDDYKDSISKVLLLDPKLILWGHNEFVVDLAAPKMILEKLSQININESEIVPIKWNLSLKLQ